MGRFRAFFSESDDEGSSSSSPSRPAAKTANGKPSHQPSYAVPGASDSSTDDSGEDESSAEGEDEDEESTDVAEEDEETEEEQEGAEDEPTAWAKQLNLEPHKVNVMQTSLFRIPELEKVTTKDNFTFLRRRLPPDIMSEPKLSRTRTTFAEPRAQPPPRKYVRVSLDESVSATNENVLVDAGLYFGRSFRAGWGPGNKLVHLGKLLSSDSLYVC